MSGVSPSCSKCSPTASRLSLESRRKFPETCLLDQSKLLGTHGPKKHDGLIFARRVHSRHFASSDSKRPKASAQCDFIFSDSLELASFM